MSAVPERSARVSTLELFFDLVFVFTITQLTGVLVDGEGAAALVQIVVMLVGVVLLLVGGALGGDWQRALWGVAAGLLWVTPQITTTEGLRVRRDRRARDDSARHRTRRHRSGRSDRGARHGRARCGRPRRRNRAVSRRAGDVRAPATDVGSQ